MLLSSPCVFGLILILWRLSKIGESENQKGTNFPRHVGIGNNARGPVSRQKRGEGSVRWLGMVLDGQTDQN